AFSNLVVDQDASDVSLTIPIDLDTGRQYFWRVRATNACGTSGYSTPRSFIVGACFEAWAAGAPVPVANGPAQASAVATPAGRVLVIGGGVGFLPDARIDQVWELDPATESWSQKADVPTPGIGSNFGSATELGGTVYTFG